MFPEGEDRSYFLFIKHLGSWADLSQDAIDLDHDLSLAIEVLRTYDAKCSVSGDAVQAQCPPGAGGDQGAPESGLSGGI
jgi:hypothetical protein